MALRFREEGHTYELDGARVPNVTGVLESAGVVNFAMLPGFVRQAALDRGTAVHRAIHYWNEGDLDVAGFVDEYPAYAPYLLGWVAFCEERKPTPVLCEHRVASRRHDFAGTIDYLGVLDGEGVLLDFATGNPQDLGKDLQTAAYLGAALEWQYEPGEDALRAFFERHAYVRRFAVRLTNSGRFRIEAYERPTDYSDFLTLLAARRIVDNRRGDWDDYMKGIATW